jgi:hypothetical protein
MNKKIIIAVIAIIGVVAVSGCIGENSSNESISLDGVKFYIPNDFILAPQYVEGENVEDIILLLEKKDPTSSSKIFIETLPGNKASDYVKQHYSENLEEIKIEGIVFYKNIGESKPVGKDTITTPQTEYIFDFENKVFQVTFVFVSDHEGKLKEILGK